MDLQISDSTDSDNNGGCRTPTVPDRDNNGGCRTPTASYRDNNGGCRTPTVSYRDNNGGCRTPTVPDRDNNGGCRTPTVSYRDNNGGCRTPTVSYRDNNGGCRTPTVSYRDNNGGCRTPTVSYRDNNGGCRTPTVSYRDNNGGCRTPTVSYQDNNGGCRTPTVSYRVNEGGCRTPAVTDNQSASALTDIKSEQHHEEPDIGGLPTLVNEQEEETLLQDERQRNNHCSDNETFPVLTKQTASIAEVSFVGSPRTGEDSDNKQGLTHTLEAYQHGDVIRYRRPSSNENQSPSKHGTFRTDDFDVENEDTNINKGTEDNVILVREKTYQPNKFLNPYVSLCPRAVSEYSRKGCVSREHCSFKSSAIVTEKAKDTMTLSENYFASLSPNEHSNGKELLDEVISAQNNNKHLTSASNDMDTSAFTASSVQTNTLSSEPPRELTGYEYVLQERHDTEMDSANNIANSFKDNSSGNKPHNNHCKASDTQLKENRNNSINENENNIIDDSTVNKTNHSTCSSRTEKHASLLSKLALKLQNNKKLNATEETETTTQESCAVDENVKSSTNKPISSKRPKSVMVVSQSLYNDAKARQKARHNSGSVENEEPKRKRRRRTKSAVQLSTQHLLTLNERSARYAEFLAQIYNINNQRNNHIQHEMFSNNTGNNDFFSHPTTLKCNNELLQMIESQRGYGNFVRGPEINVDDELNRHFDNNNNNLQMNSHCASEVRNEPRNDVRSGMEGDGNVPKDVTYNVNEFQSDREAIQALYGSGEVAVSAVPSVESQGSRIYSRALGTLVEATDKTQTLSNEVSSFKNTGNKSSKLVPTSLEHDDKGPVQTCNWTQEPADTGSMQRVSASTGNWTQKPADPGYVKQVSPVEPISPPAADFRQQYQVGRFVPHMRSPDTSRHLPFIPYRDIPCHPPVSACPRVVSYRSQLPHLQRLLDTPAQPPPYPCVPHQRRDQTHNGSQAQMYDAISPPVNEINGDAITMLHSPPNSEGRRRTEEQRSDASNIMPQCQNTSAANGTIQQPKVVDFENEGRQVTSSRIAPQGGGNPSLNTNTEDRWSTQPNRDVSQPENTPSNLERLELPGLPHHIHFPGYGNTGHPNQNMFRPPPYSYIPRRQSLPPNHTVPFHENTRTLPRNAVPRFPDIPNRRDSLDQRYQPGLGENTGHDNGPCPDLDSLRAMFAMNQRVPKPRRRTTPDERLTSPQTITRQIPQLQRVENDKEQPPFTPGQFSEAYAAIQSSFIQQHGRPRQERQTENVFTEITNRLWNQGSPATNHDSASKGKDDN